MSLVMPKGVKQLFGDLSKPQFGDKYNLIGTKEGDLEIRHLGLDSFFINDADRLRAAENLSKVFEKYAGNIKGDSSLNAFEIKTNLEKITDRMGYEKDSGNVLSSNVKKIFSTIVNAEIPKDTLRVFQYLSDEKFAKNFVLVGEKKGGAYEMGFFEKGSFGARFVSTKERLQASSFIKEAASNHVNYFKAHDGAGQKNCQVDRHNMVLNLYRMQAEAEVKTSGAEKVEICRNLQEAIEVLRPDLEVTNADIDLSLIPDLGESNAYASLEKTMKAFSPEESFQAVKGIYGAIRFKTEDLKTDLQAIRENLGKLHALLIKQEKEYFLTLNPSIKGNEAKIKESLKRMNYLDGAFRGMVSVLNSVPGSETLERFQDLSKIGYSIEKKELDSPEKCLNLTKLIKEEAQKYAGYFKENDYKLVKGHLVSRFNMVRNLQNLHAQIFGLNDDYFFGERNNLQAAIKALSPTVFEYNSKNELYFSNGRRVINEFEKDIVSFVNKDTFRDLGSLLNSVMNNPKYINNKEEFVEKLLNLRVVLLKREEIDLVSSVKNPEENEDETNEIIFNIRDINEMINQMIKKISETSSSQGGFLNKFV